MIDNRKNDADESAARAFVVCMAVLFTLGGGAAFCDAGMRTAHGQETSRLAHARLGAARESQPMSGLPPAPTSAPFLSAARVCYAEAEFRQADCIAILHVARKRAERTGRSWQAELWRYSSLRRSHGPRARWVRHLPDGDVRGKGAAWNTRWRDLRGLIARFDAGLLEDPCPNAFGWGGPMDSRRPGQVRVRCAVKMANWFYRLPAVRS